MTDFLFVLCIGITVIIVLGFVGYMFTTNRIIKDQEQQIAELNKQLEDERTCRDITTR